MHPLSLKKKKSIFALILITSILCSLIATGSASIMPAITKTFHTPFYVGQWFTSIFSLVMGILALCSAYLTRRFPAKPLFITALCLFTFGIFLNGGATSFFLVLLGRALQAAGNGILISQCQILLLTMFDQKIHGRIMGIYGLASYAAPVVSPLLFGLITDFWNWRIIFAVVGVFCIAAILLAFFVMDNITTVTQLPLDYISLTLCILGFGGLLYGVGRPGNPSIMSFSSIGTILIGTLCCIFFILRQFYLKTPFLNIRILTQKRLRLAVIASALYYFIMIGLTVLTSYDIQQVHHYTVTTYGLMLIPGSLCTAVFNPFMGRIYDRSGIRNLLFLGSLFLITGILGSGYHNGVVWIFILGNSLRAIGIAMLMMPLVAWGMSRLPKKEIPSGQTLIVSIRTIAGSFGSAFGLVFAGFLGQYMKIETAMHLTYGVFILVAGILALLALTTSAKK